MFAIILGMLSSVVTLVVFLTGKPSIQHFFPLLPETRRRLPSPFLKWRFVVRNDALFLRTRGLEVTLLPRLEYVAEYRIFVSERRKKVMVVHRNNGESRFKHVVFANFDGSHRQHHYFMGGIIIDARWFDTDKYLVFLQGDVQSSYPYRYPSSWYSVSASAIGERDWFEASIQDGNFLVTLDEQNQVTDVRRY